MDDFIMLESTNKGYGDYVRRNEDYYDKLRRISNSPYSRIFVVDHPGRHVSVYNLIMPGKNGWLRIVAETVSEMEVIGPNNPKCVICWNLWGKIRGLLHIRQEIHELARVERKSRYRVSWENN